MCCHYSAFDSSASVQYSRIQRMASAAEDMTLEDFRRLCDGMVCRALTSRFICHEPLNTFHHLNFPMVALDGLECNPSVHFLDVVKGYHVDVSLEELGRQYKAAVVNKDFLPSWSTLSSRINARPLSCRILSMGSSAGQTSCTSRPWRKSSSPIFAWPHGLVQKALRQLSAEGALARKEFAWPLPLTPVFFQTWLLEILEEIWNFDRSSLVMLGGPACGKSPLGRGVLMAQCRFNQQKFNVAGEPGIRCSPEIGFLRGEAGTVIMGDFLDDPCMQGLGLKALKSLLDVLGPLGSCQVGAKPTTRFGCQCLWSWCGRRRILHTHIEVSCLLGALPLQRSHKGQCWRHFETCHFPCQYQAVCVLQEACATQEHSWCRLFHWWRQEMVWQIQKRSQRPSPKLCSRGAEGTGLAGFDLQEASRWAAARLGDSSEGAWSLCRSSSKRKLPAEGSFPTWRTCYSTQHVQICPWPWRRSMTMPAPTHPPLT